MTYDWSACYQESKTPNGFKGDLFCPIIKDDIIYICKCEVVQTYKDIKMPLSFVNNDYSNLKFSIKLKIEKKFLGIFKYKTNLYIDDVAPYYLSQNVIQSLDKTLYTFKDSESFKKYTFDKKFKDLIEEKNLGNEKYCTKTNHFDKKLIFNKEVKKIDYSTRLCFN